MPSTWLQGVEEHTQQPWHAQPCFGPLAFYDVAGKVWKHIPLELSLHQKLKAYLRQGVCLWQPQAFLSLRA